MTAPYPPVNGSEPCRRNPDRWFTGDRPAALAAAKAGCRTCHVLDQCAAYALTARAGAHAVTGIWGATSSKDREQIRRDRQLSLERPDFEPHGSPAAVKQHNRSGEPLCGICQYEDSRRRVDRQQHAA